MYYAECYKRYVILRFAHIVWLAIILSNVPVLREESLFAWTMTAGGVGITLAAARSLMAGIILRLTTAS